MGEPRMRRERVRTARRRTASSTRWLERQLNDPYVQRGRQDGYRARSAYKLLEIDARYSILKTARAIVDFGAAPGSWAQIAATHHPGPARQIIAVDLVEMDPVAGVDFIRGDALAAITGQRICEQFGEVQPDLVLSDMAARTTGHKRTDHLRTTALLEAVVDFSLARLAHGGVMLAKAFQGGAEAQLLARLKQNFASVRHVKPAASRAESPEIYVLATGFRGQTHPSD